MGMERYVSILWTEEEETSFCPYDAEPKSNL
jgi:hypothetical protein